MEPPPSRGYAFGDDETAERRLEVVARVFEAPSRAFLREALDDRPSPRLAVDLGCGPGHSTRLLAEVSGAARTVGLDTSAAFVREASTRATHGTRRIEFVVYDATVVPFSCGPADVIYARLLLAHLPRPADAVAAWRTQLRPAGVLLIEENDWIRSTNAILCRYEEIVSALLASRGADLYPGQLLSVLADHSELRVHQVSTADAATMFSLNLSVWRSDPFITANHPPDEIDDLARALAGLTTSQATGEITWGLRQAIFAG